MHIFLNMCDCLKETKYIISNKIFLILWIKIRSVGNTMNYYLKFTNLSFKTTRVRVCVEFHYILAQVIDFSMREKEGKIAFWSLLRVSDVYLKRRTSGSCRTIFEKKDLCIQVR